MKLDLVVGALAVSERRLAASLREAAETHRDEADVHFGALDLAAWSDEHSERLQAALTSLPPTTAEPPVGAFDVGALVPPDGAAGGTSLDPSLQLLRDLRLLYLLAADVSLQWEVLAQAAQAARSDQLTDLASDCHPQTLRQLRWANTLLKTAAPQAVIAG